MNTLEITDYQWYKSKGICVRCRQDYAQVNQTMCPECGTKSAEYSRKRLKNLKANPEKYLQYLEKQRIRKKTAYYKAKDAGLCVICRKRKPQINRVSCFECLAYRRKWYREHMRKIRGDDYVEVWRRQGLNLCYFCAKPVVRGKRTCETHRKMCADRIALYRRKNETWAALNNVLFDKRR